jgi:AcrR family transcriptional regulator
MDALDQAEAAEPDAWAAVRAFLVHSVDKGRGAVAAALAGTAAPQARQALVRRLDELVRQAQADGAMRSDAGTGDLMELLNVFACHPGVIPEHFLAFLLDGLDSDGGQAFPASIEAAWGLGDRPRKGPKRGLTLERIVSAAVEVADEDGLDAVSMSRVGDRLGSSTMALYRYVATKDELLTLMLDAAVGPPPPLPEGLGRRRGLESWATSMRAAILAHPWTVHLLTPKGPPATPNQLAWLDQFLLILQDTGLPARAKLATQLLISGHVWSHVSITAAITLDTEPEGLRRWSGYEPFLRRVTGAGRLPGLRAALDEGAFGADPGAPDDHFVFGLERALDGVEAHIRSLARPGPAT